jgi:four helix bundle protein
VRENVIQQKSYQFALKTIKLCRLLRDQKEFTLSQQLLDSGTSIGANVEEAIGGASKKDFIAKMNIACKEARESNYWLRLLRDSNTCPAIDLNEIIQDSEALKKILHSIVKSSRSNGTSGSNQNS